MNAVTFIGAVQYDTFDEFCSESGLDFPLDLDEDLLRAEGTAYLRDQVPPDVAVIRLDYEDDGRACVHYYLVCCRRGFLFAYKAY